MAQRDVNELYRAAMTGQLSRRQVLRRALAMGLSAPAIASILAACGEDDEDDPADDAGSETDDASDAEDSEETPADEDMEDESEAEDTPEAGDEDTEDSEDSEPAELQRATLKLNWVPNAEHAPYFLGRDMGFYEEEGVDIEIEPGQGSATAVQLVGTGDSMFGVAVSDAVTVGRGQGIPVVSVAVLLQQSPTVLVSLAESDITEPTDLYGNQVGVNPQSTVYAYWLAFLAVNDLDTDQIEEVNIAGGTTVQLLINGDIDATGLLLTNEVVTVRNEGYEVNIIDYGEYGVRAYGQALFTNEDMIANDPELVGRFTRATVRSWEYALENIDEAIDALAEAIPETDWDLERAKWDVIPDLVYRPDGEEVFGLQTEEGWEETYNTFLEGEVIENEFDPSEIFSNDYLPEDDE